MSEKGKCAVSSAGTKFAATLDRAWSLVLTLRDVRVNSAAQSGGFLFGI